MQDRAVLLLMLALVAPLTSAYSIDKSLPFRQQMEAEYLARQKLAENSRQPWQAKQLNNPIKAKPITNARDPKIFFGLFASVEPVACTGSSSGSAGICKTDTGCASSGGTQDGTCFQAFSFCCVYESSTCGAQLNQEVGTIQNPNYPDAYTGGETCSFRVNKQEGACQLRVQFEDVVLADPELGECGNDTLIISGDSFQSIPTMCGTLTDDTPIIVNMLEVGSVDFTFNLANATLGNSTSTWKIKVTQVQCTSEDLAPPGCLTYGTETSGNIRSLNSQYGSGQMLADYSGAHCLKYQSGFCDVSFTESFFDVGDGALTIGNEINTGSDFTSTTFDFVGPYVFPVKSPPDNSDMVVGYSLDYELQAC